MMLKNLIDILWVCFQAIQKQEIKNWKGGFFTVELRFELIFDLSAPNELKDKTNLLNLWTKVKMFQSIHWWQNSNSGTLWVWVFNKRKVFGFLSFSKQLIFSKWISNRFQIFFSLQTQYCFSSSKLLSFWFYIILSIFLWNTPNMHPKSYQNQLCV